jgi:hypothetical protein
MQFRAFALLTLLVSAGCSTPGGYKIENLDRPLLDLQAVASKSMPLGLRKTSVNGREYFSQYFIASERKFKPAEKSPVRSYAHIFVLGDRRPYTIQIIVHREKLTKVNGSTAFVETGLDHPVAKVVRSRVVQQLNKRREELNIIDDFRVF